MNDSTCPCRVTAAKPLSLSACCGPYLEGAPAPSPETLMRARYSAYALNDVDFLLHSLAPEARHDFDRKSVAHWSKTSQWLGLDILNAEAGGPDDNEGFVEFVAHFIADGSKQDHRERSRFRRDTETGGWLFVEAANRKMTPIVKEKLPGRNDPCHCGSGKKFKKCHGAAAA